MSILDTARTYFTAIQTGDLDTVASSLAEEVVWHQPGEPLLRRPRRSRRRLRHARPDDAVSADLVAATIHFQGQRDGATMSMDGVDVLRIADGKIAEVWLFSADQPAEDLFWGQ